MNTVIVFSSSLAATTFAFDQGELIGLYLAVQVTALAGAFLLAKPTDAWGPKKVVTLSLVLWSFVAVGAFFVASKSQFWFIACTAGLGLGSVQAGTRAFFAQFILKGKEAEYFGVYALVGKSSAILGPLVRPGVRGLRKPASGHPVHRRLLYYRAPGRVKRPSENSKAKCPARSCRLTTRSSAPKRAPLAC